MRAWEQRILDQRQVPEQRAAGVAEFTRRPILLRLPTASRVVTTVGRGLFNMEVEDGPARGARRRLRAGDYTYINYTMTKKGLAAFINKLVALYGANKVARILDVFKEVGFRFATRAAVTVSKNDVVIPEKREGRDPDRPRGHGRPGPGAVQQRLPHRGGAARARSRRSGAKPTSRSRRPRRANFNPLNPIYMMATSGARGDIKQIRQLAGWRGQMSNPKGEIVEQPVKSSFIEGLSVLEFFISTHGARKGLADTALRTADSGLPHPASGRRVPGRHRQRGGLRHQGVGARCRRGRRRRRRTRLLEGTTLAEDVKRPRSDRVVLKKGAKIGPAPDRPAPEVYSTLPNAKVKVKQGKAATAKHGHLDPRAQREPARPPPRRRRSSTRRPARSSSTATRTSTSKTRDQILEFLARSSQTDPMVPVRSVLKCDAEIGVCQKCYGYALANNAPAEIGDAVGHVAAQSIGEPGTQLTMRTFHTGGVAGADITHGLPRVVELFEARKPKGVARIAEVTGRVAIEETERGSKVTIIAGRRHVEGVHHRRARTHVMVEDGDWVEEGTQLTPGSLYPADLLKHAAATRPPSATSSTRCRRSTARRASRSTTSTSSSSCAA